MVLLLLLVHVSVTNVLSFSLSHTLIHSTYPLRIKILLTEQSCSNHPMAHVQ